MSALKHRGKLTRLAIHAVVAAALVGVALCHPAWAARGVVVSGGSPGNLTVFNLATGNTVTIPYDFFKSPRWVAVTDDGRFAGVTSGDGKTVAWVDLRNQQAPAILGKTFVDSNPKGIAIKGSIAVVAVDDPTTGHPDSVKIIDISGLPHIPRDAQITSLPLDASAAPEGVAITPDGRFALVVQAGLSNVAYVDLTGLAPVLLASRTPVGAGAFGVAVTPDGSRALVSNTGAATLSIISLTGLPIVPGAALVTAVPVGNSPQGVAISADGTTAIVAEAGSADTARFLDLATLASTPVSLTTAAAGDPNPFGAALLLAAGGLQAVVSNEDAGTVSVVDAVTHAVVLTIGIGPSPRGLALLPHVSPKAKIVADATSGPSPLTVTFNGSGSSGAIVSYTFDFGDGTSVTSPSPVATRTYAVPGKFAASLVVTDDDGVSSSAARTTIQAKPTKPPKAILTVSPASGIAPLVVTLDGSASTDPDGTVVSYTFDFGDGSSVTTSNPVVTHPYAAPGTFTAGLVVTDNSGTASDRAHASVSVSANKAPNARLSARPQSGVAPLTATLDGSASTDSDGTVTSYVFDFGDGSSVTTSSPTVTHTYAAAGTFSAGLVVVDNKGAPSKSTRTSVNVKVNQPPTAGFRIDPASGPAPLKVSFTSQSKDIDGQIAAFHWDFGDGASSSAASPSHTYTTPGKFVVTLTVTDDKGASAQKTGNVDVKVAR